MLSVLSTCVYTAQHLDGKQVLDFREKQDGNTWDGWGWGYASLVKSSRRKIMKGLVRT